MKYFVKTVNILLIISSVGLLFWLVNLNFPRSRQIDINVEFGKDQPMLTRLGPDSRVKIENGQEAILADPVYFNLRSLPWFKKLRIKIVYQESGRILNGIGPQMSAGWQYEISKPIASSTRNDGLTEAYFDFDLGKIYQINNVRRFAISSSLIAGADNGQINIESLNITLYQ